MRIAVNRSHFDESTLAYISKYEAHERIPSWSLLKLCLMAEALAELYPYFDRAIEWEIRAGQAVLEGAGGGVFVRGSIESLTHSKAKSENPSLVAASSSDLIIQ